MSNKIPWQRVLTFLYFAKGATIPSTGQTIPGWLQNHPDDTKFKYALERVSESALKANAEMERKIEDLQIDHQATGEHGVLLYNPDKSRAYTAAGEKALRDAKAALMESEVHIEPHYCSELPELPEGAREILAGFVIKPEEARLEAVA